LILEAACNNLKNAGEILTLADCASDLVQQIQAAQLGLHAPLRLLAARNVREKSTKGHRPAAA